MIFQFRRSLLCLCFLALLGSGQFASANPVGDFFKKVGRSISKIGKSSPPPKKTHKLSSRQRQSAPPAIKPSPSPTPSPTPRPLEIRPATGAPPSPQPRDVPYGVAVPDRPGLVTSPYAPDEGLVDVRGFPSSTEVMDPFTGKIFLTP